MKKSVFIIGAGAVGGSLAKALHSVGYKFEGVFDVDQSRALAVAKTIGAQEYSSKFPKELNSAKIVIIAAPDRELHSIALNASKGEECFGDACWLHTCGRFGADILEPLKHKVLAVGAFHPAFPFSPSKITKLPHGVGFAVDGSKAAVEIASAIAEDLGGFTVQVPSEVRATYHAATVMASNYVAALLKEAKDSLADSHVISTDIERLLAFLARSQAQRAIEAGIEESLSGPILRGDTQAVAEHLNALASKHETLEIYRCLGRANLRLAVQNQALDLDTINNLLDLLKNNR